MNELEKQFMEAKDKLLEKQELEINEWLHKELIELENKNISYEIMIGSYDYDGFNIDRSINNDQGVMIDNGFNFVDYLKNYCDRLDYSAVCQLQIRVDDNDDKPNMDIMYIEYNGYELFYDSY